MKQMIHDRSIYRLTFRAAVWAAIVLCAGLMTPFDAPLPAQAQDGGQPISVGEIVTGTLNSTNFIQIYALSASAGDTISIDVNTEVEELEPVVVVTDERGSVVASDTDVSTASSATITEFELPSSGTFYIQVMRASGVSGDASGDFTLQLSGFQQIGGQTVELTDGGLVFEVALERGRQSEPRSTRPGGRHRSPPAPRCAERRRARCGRQRQL